MCALDEELQVLQVYLFACKPLTYDSGVVVNHHVAACGCVTGSNLLHPSSCKDR